MWQLLVVIFNVARPVLMPRTSQPCKYVIDFHIKNVGYILLIFCWLRLHTGQDGVYDSSGAHHRKLSHSSSQLAHPTVDDREERQPGNLPVRFKHDHDYFSLVQSNSVEWNWEICDLFFLCMCVFCFTPPTMHGSLPQPLLPLFFSLIFRSRRDDVFQEERLRAYCPLAPQAPICN